MPHIEPGSRAELFELAFDGFHERRNEPIAEIKPCSSRSEQLGKRPRASQRQRLLVVGDGPRPVAQGSLPDLERPELGDTVFDVIERVQENVELAMPQMVAGFFVAGPIDDSTEAIEQLSPGGGPFETSMIGVGIDPMLKRVDRRDPGEDQHDSLEQLAVRAAGLRRLVKWVEPCAPKSSIVIEATSQNSRGLSR